MADAVTSSTRKARPTKLLVGLQRLKGVSSKAVAFALRRLSRLWRRRFR